MKHGVLDSKLCSTTSPEKIQNKTEIAVCYSQVLDEVQSMPQRATEGSQGRVRPRVRQEIGEAHAFIRVPGFKHRVNSNQKRRVLESTTGSYLMKS